MQDDLEDWNRATDRYHWKRKGVPRDFQQIAPGFFARVGDPAGLRILDLGCGNGWLTRFLADRGAHVMGIDGSSRLIESARELNPGITFEVQDLRAPMIESPGPSSWDFVVTHMVLMDLPVLDPVFRLAARALKPSGRLLASFLHPCFADAPVAADESGTQFRMVTHYLRQRTMRIETFGGHNRYHRPLGDYVSALRRNGLVLTGMFEPPNHPAIKGMSAAFADELPSFILIEAALYPVPPTAVEE